MDKSIESVELSWGECFVAEDAVSLPNFGLYSWWSVLSGLNVMVDAKLSLLP